MKSLMLSEGERFLKIAEDAHVRGDPHAIEWYLRAIAHLLVEISRSHAIPQSGEPRPASKPQETT